MIAVICRGRHHACGDVPEKAPVGKQLGFSLVELLVAVILLAFGALAAVTMQRTAVRSNQASFSREVAASLARQLLEATKNLSYFDPRLAATAYVAPPASLSPANPLDSEGRTAARGFTRTWEITDNTPTANVKQIRVRIEWNQAGQDETFVLATLRSPGDPA